MPLIVHKPPRIIPVSHLKERLHDNPRHILERRRANHTRDIGEKHIVHKGKKGPLIKPLFTHLRDLSDTKTDSKHQPPKQ